MHVVTAGRPERPPVPGQSDAASLPPRYLEDKMRSTLIAAATAGVLTLTGCGASPAVQTSAQPDPALNARLTFHLVAEPGYLGGITAGANHSPLMNQGTSAALRHDIVAGLTRRGYVEDDQNAGVVVVYYLAMPPSTDFTDWNNGYLWRPSWARGYLPGSVDLSPLEYADGAVVIDMVDSRTGSLLWQGHRETDLPEDERRLARDLRQTVGAILAAAPGPSVALK